MLIIQLARFNLFFLQIKVEKCPLLVCKHYSYCVEDICGCFSVHPCQRGPVEMQISTGNGKVMGCYELGLCGHLGLSTEIFCPPAKMGASTSHSSCSAKLT